METKVCEYRNSKGQTVQGRVIKENKLTALVLPHKWLKSKVIKIHKKKQYFKLTGEVI